MIITCPICVTEIALKQGRFVCPNCTDNYWFSGTFQDGQINSYGIHINEYSLVYSNVSHTMLLCINGIRLLTTYCSEAPNPSDLNKEKVLNIMHRLLNLKAFI